MSLVPGIFQINEPIIFGLPIVLNPIMIIPFILTPMVNILVGYFVTVIWPIMPTPAIGVPWTTPGIINLFLGTGGNAVAAIVGVVCLAISVLIYLPFVIASNRSQKSKRNFLGGKNYEQQNAKRFSMGWRNCCPSSRRAWNVAGRGMSIADVMTAGGTGFLVKSREASKKMCIILITKRSTFITATKKIFNYSKR